MPFLTELTESECFESEKAFWQYWKKRWPFSSRNKKVLSLSAKFRNTKEAFLAGWEANGKNTEQPLQPNLQTNTQTKE